MPLLAAFDAAAEKGHITRAAGLLGVPQSSLSRRLKALEKTLGVPLFQPAGRRVALTPRGANSRAHQDLVWALDDAVARCAATRIPRAGSCDSVSRSPSAR